MNLLRTATFQWKLKYSLFTYKNSNDFQILINRNDSVLFDKNIVNFFELDPIFIEKYFFMKESTETKTSIKNKLK